MRAPLFVLGMHRSGTSAITGALHRAGFSLGSKSQLLLGDEYNQSGYFELYPVVQANERMRYILGMSGNPCLNIPEDWQSFENMSVECKALSQVLDYNFGKKDHEVLKDPRISLMLPIYREIYSDSWDEAKALICFRNPLDVARSLCKRDQFSQQSALGLWVQHTLCALRNSRGMKRRVINYKDFLEDPVKALNPILDLYPDLVVEDKKKETIRASVRKELNHGSFEAVDTVSPDLIGWTYDLCQNLSANPELLDESFIEAEIDQLWAEFEAWWTLPPVDMILSSIFFLSYGDSRTGKTIFRSYIPQQKLQTIEVEFEAAKNTEVRLQLSHWPGTIWIRQAGLIDEGGVEHALNLQVGQNISPQKMPAGIAWNLFGPGAHCLFPSLGGKQKLIFKFSSWVDLGRVSDLMTMVWNENAELKMQISQNKARTNASFH